MFQVTGLYIYPIKSCGGVEVLNWPVTRYGFMHDREFLVVDGEWNFLTQRTHPKLALIQPFPESDQLRVRAPNLQRSTYPGLDRLRITRSSLSGRLPFGGIK
jgi:uncharacterized protein